MPPTTIAPPSAPPRLVFVPSPDAESARAWEAAYRRFETPECEVRKFTRRLRWMGADGWSRDARIADLFCGRGGGLTALTRLGFRDVEGVDLSADLLRDYDGPARTIAADCRALPWPDASKDVVMINGGLHHLERLPDDLERVLDEMQRVLVPGGLVAIVEPWLTPFLSTVHGACAVRPFRRAWARLDALATMIEHEQRTYDAWLAQPDVVLSALERRFDPVRVSTRLGKLRFLGGAGHAATASRGVAA
jgi:ubiquinone/menaquinone biosynthesis C-methylase UbiE